MSKVENSYRWDEEAERTDYEEVATVDWTDESYQFDMTRVYKQISTGALFYAEDSGCSCPSPFEDTEDYELTPITRMQVWHDHVSARTVQEDPDDEFQYPYPTTAGTVDQAHRVTRQISDLIKQDTGTGRVWEYKRSDLY